MCDVVDWEVVDGFVGVFCVVMIECDVVKIRIVFVSFFDEVFLSIIDCVEE